MIPEVLSKEGRDFLLQCFNRCSAPQLPPLARAHAGLCACRSALGFSKVVLVSAGRRVSIIFRDCGGALWFLASATVQRTHVSERPCPRAAQEPKGAAERVAAAAPRLAGRPGAAGHGRAPHQPLRQHRPPPGTRAAPSPSALATPAPESGQVKLQHVMVAFLKTGWAAAIWQACRSRSPCLAARRKLEDCCAHLLAQRVRKGCILCRPAFRARRTCWRCRRPSRRSRRRARRATEAHPPREGACQSRAPSHPARTCSAAPQRRVVCSGHCGS